MCAQDTKKEAVWLLPASRKEDLRGGLYLTATPIGNLRDITIRALDTLAAADLVVCEDTRVTGKLLSHYGLKKSLIPYNDHNADRQRPAILRKLKEGQAVVLVSDSGTPLVSDPGYRLVRSCLEEGLAVTALPGANAPLTALQLSGLPSDSFCFLGFLPPRDKARRDVLEKWKAVETPLIVFETAPRLRAALQAINEVLGARDVAVVRELTKMYEEVLRGPVSELAGFYAEHGPPKGEIVLVIGPGESVAPSPEAVDGHLREALKTMGTKEAAAHVAALTGLPKKELYSRILNLSDLLGLGA
ncbi:MAG: 16S rRNA (cytidine(1402)-2'-O)-methyltransferase [Alphaproteobacteria bacterium]|nr:16S rRNA (cytidine(1402)-2'-O)-methyltransferase [Alphaproteobacteria bacterium]